MSKGTGRKREHVFLTVSLVTLMLLVHRLRLELQGLTWWFPECAPRKTISNSIPGNLLEMRTLKPHP